MMSIIILPKKIMTRILGEYMCKSKIKCVPKETNRWVDKNVC